MRVQQQQQQQQPHSKTNSNNNNNTRSNNSSNNIQFKIVSSYLLADHSRYPPSSSSIVPP
eukprot:6832528-Pyramimonas_sp.AAC.1